MNATVPVPGPVLSLKERDRRWSGLRALMRARDLDAIVVGSVGGGGPPPIPGESPFFVAVNGQQTGPFDVATLRLHAQTGKLTPGLLVWRQGMGTWTKAGEVTELKEIFAGAAPPPIPQG